jgi:hypothetical protein
MFALARCPIVRQSRDCPPLNLVARYGLRKPGYFCGLPHQPGAGCVCSPRRPWAGLSLFVRMYPFVGCDLPLLGQLDHMHRWRVAALPAGSAFQRRFQFPQRRISWAPDARVLHRLHSTSSQHRPPLRHWPMVGEGCVGPP